MACINVRFIPVGSKDPDTHADLKPGITVRFLEVCGSGIGAGFLHSCDALLITSENGRLIVQPSKNI